METEVTVREIMTREYLGVSESDTVGDAVELMLEEATAGVVVLRGANPIGMLTTTDALELAASGADPDETEVGSVMSGTVPSVDPEVSIAEAAGRMADAGTGSVLVQSDDAVAGVVSERDVVRATATLADRPARPERTAPADPEAVVTAVEAESASDGGAEAEYSTQSVCEICGSLTPELQNFNGQLVCVDCREI